MSGVAAMDSLSLVGEVMFLGFLSIIAIRVLLVASRHQGLLASRTGDPAEPERVLALVCSLVTVGAYAAQCLANPGAHFSLPEPSTWLIWLASAGQAGYLVGKAQRLR